MALDMFKKRIMNYKYSSICDGKLLAGSFQRLYQVAYNFQIEGLSSRGFTSGVWIDP